MGLVDWKKVVQVGGLDLWWSQYLGFGGLVYFISIKKKLKIKKNDKGSLGFQGKESFWL